MDHDVAFKQHALNQLLACGGHAGQWGHSGGEDIRANKALAARRRGTWCSLGCEEIRKGFQEVALSQS